MTDTALYRCVASSSIEFTVDLAKLSQLCASVRSRREIFAVIRLHGWLRRRGKCLLLERPMIHVQLPFASIVSSSNIHTCFLQCFVTCGFRSNRISRFKSSHSFLRKIASTFFPHSCSYRNVFLELWLFLNSICIYPFLHLDCPFAPQISFTPHHIAFKSYAFWDCLPFKQKETT